EPRHRVHVQRRNEQLGEDARLGARVRKPREEARVVPVRERREDQLVEIAQHVRERLAALGRRSRQGGAHRAWLDGRRDAAFADRPQVRVRPVGCAIEVLAKCHGRFFRSFSICFHARVLSTSSFVSHARRAWPIPSSTKSSAPTSWPSESTTSLSPASRAARACTSVRSRRSGCELISRNVPVSSAFWITTPTSTGDG